MSRCDTQHSESVLEHLLDRVGRLLRGMGHMMGWRDCTGHIMRCLGKEPKVLKGNLEYRGRNKFRKTCGKEIKRAGCM